jgi:hypothetical protein
MRMLNAIEAGMLTGAQLEALLAGDPGRRAELSVLMGMPGQVRRMAASSTAMTAVVASSTAMAAVAASNTAMAAVAASNTAMTAVVASSTAMAAVAASGTGRLALWNSDTALAAIQASTTAVTTMMAVPTAVISSTVSPHTFVGQGTKVVLLRRWYNSSDTDSLRWSRTNGDLPGYGSTAIGYGPTYNNAGTFPNADNNFANNVRACNGLSRGDWQNGATLYVRYLPV